MEPFVRLEAVAAPLPVVNVDTDQIIPARYIKTPRAVGYSQFLFHDLRFRDGGEVPGFFLNDPRWRDARILVAGENFGCGSSRETAVYALWDHGFRVVVAPSFGDIFDSNAFKNGLLTIRLPASEVSELLAMLDHAEAVRATVDLQDMRLRLSNGHAVDFEIDAFRRECLMKGFDELQYTLRMADEIAGFERRYESAHPWGALPPAA